MTGSINSRNIVFSYRRAWGNNPSASTSDARVSDDVCLRCFAALFDLNFVVPSIFSNTDATSDSQVGSDSQLAQGQQLSLAAVFKPNATRRKCSLRRK